MHFPVATTSVHLAKPDSFATMSSIWCLKNLSYTPREPRNLMQSVRRALAKVDEDIYRELAKLCNDGAFMVVARCV